MEIRRVRWQRRSFSLLVSCHMLIGPTVEQRGLNHEHRLERDFSARSVDTVTVTITQDPNFSQISRLSTDLGAISAHIPATSPPQARPKPFTLTGPYAGPGKTTTKAETWTKMKNRGVSHKTKNAPS